MRWVIALILATIAGSAQAETFSANSFQLYYGSKPTIFRQMLSRLKKNQVAVVDTRALNATQLRALLTRSHSVGAKVIGYISIGELHDREKKSFETFAPKAKDVYLSRNDQFKSTRVNVQSPQWQRWIFRKVDALYKLGMDGLFLDTIDTVDTYINRLVWPLKRRKKSVEAMIQFIRAIKAKNAAKYVLMNRGLNLIGENVFVGDPTGRRIPGLSLKDGVKHNPDGVLWENAFASNDDWTKAVKKKLDAIHMSKKATVFALGYRATLRNEKKFFEQCAKWGYIPAWATASDQLHKELTR